MIYFINNHINPDLSFKGRDFRVCGENAVNFVVRNFIKCEIRAIKLLIIFAKFVTK